MEMIDQTATINLIDLCPTPMKRVASTGGGEYHGPCPVCGGRDRFVIQPQVGNGGRWWCRQCQQSGDTVAFCQFAFGDDFKSALERLRLESQSTERRPVRRQPQAPVHPSQPSKVAASHSEAWQQAAHRFVMDSVQRLWSPAGKNAYQYLGKRGIRYHLVQRALLGYNEQWRTMQWGDTEVKLPRGIVIPWIVDGHIKKVKIRRSNYDIAQQRQRLLERGTPADKINIPKYAQAKGAASHDLYCGAAISSKRPVVMVETELDALLLQMLGDGSRQFTAVATGSASDGLTTRNAALLCTAQHVYCALDADPAGYRGFLKWQYALGKRQITRLLPDECDPGETFERYGWVGLSRWLDRERCHG